MSETTAFPRDGGQFSAPRDGMSLRDWFAGQVLMSIAGTNPNLPDDPATRNYWPAPEELANRRARWSYLQADAMLAARDDNTGQP